MRFLNACVHLLKVMGNKRGVLPGQCVAGVQCAARESHSGISWHVGPVRGGDIKIYLQVSGLVVVIHGFISLVIGPAGGPGRVGLLKGHECAHEFFQVLALLHCVIQTRYQRGFLFSKCLILVGGH